jgi:hypothetical protein
MMQVTIQTTNEKGNFVHTKEVADLRSELRESYGVSLSWDKKTGLGNEFNQSTQVASFEATITGARRHSSSVMANGIAKTVLTLDRDVLVSYIEDVDENEMPTGNYSKVSSNELWLMDSDLERLFGLKAYNPLAFDELRLIDLSIVFKAMIIDKTTDERFNPDADGHLYAGILFMKSAGVRALPESVRLNHKMTKLYKEEFSEMTNRVATEQQRDDLNSDRAARDKARKDKAEERKATLLAAIAAEEAKKNPPADTPADTPPPADTPADTPRTRTVETKS